MSRPFLAFSYKVSGSSSTARVALWRALRELGAGYLQQSVAVLPSSTTLRARLEELRDRAAASGGAATLAALRFIHAEDEERFVAESRAARDEEYGELGENCQRLIYELDRETELGKFAFTELEESEGDLAALRRWLEKISARDYFDAPKREEARSAVERAEGRLRDYAKEVYRRDTAQAKSH